MLILGKRGRRRADLKLRLIYNLIAGGMNGPNAIRFSGLPRRTAYRYIDSLTAEGAIRRIGIAPATYEPLPAGFKYKSELGQNSKNNVAQVRNNVAQPPRAGGRDTSCQVRAAGTPSSPSQSEEVIDKAEPMAKAGLEAGAEEEPGQVEKAVHEPQDGATAGPEAGTDQQQGQAGQAGHGAREGAQDGQPAMAANGLPLLDENPEDVRPAPSVPLDHPARVHHRAVRLAIVRPADRRPQLDMLQWGPPKQDSHGQDWFKAAEVLFDDLGIVSLQEFNTCIRIWLPEKTVHDRGALERAVVHDLDRDAQRVANWLQRNYGYQLGLPEPDEIHVAFPLPDIAGRFKGWLKLKLDDGTTIVIDQSKKYAEIEFLARPASLSRDLRTILNWGCAPRLLTALQDRLLEMEQRLPQEIRLGAASAFNEVLPGFLEAFKVIIIEATQGAIQAPEFQSALRAQVRKANEEAPYQPPAGPDDNAGYG